MNTFQGFLGSLSAALASISNTKSVFSSQHWIFRRLQRGVFSLYKVYAVQKKKKKKKAKNKPSVLTPNWDKKNI